MRRVARAPRRRLFVFGLSAVVHGAALLAGSRMMHAPGPIEVGHGDTHGVAVAFYGEEALQLTVAVAEASVGATEADAAEAVLVEDPAASGDAPAEAVSLPEGGDEAVGDGEGAGAQSASGGGETAPYDPWAEATINRSDNLPSLQLALQAASCWTDTEPSGPVLMRVKLDPAGLVSAPPEAVRDDAPADVDPALEAKVRDAIERCAPYAVSATATTRDIRLVFNGLPATSLQ